MNGLVVAVDTATDVCAIGLGRREGRSVAPLSSLDFEARRAAMSGLLPALSTAFHSAGVSLGEVTQVVVGRGPGSFTGVRIGVASAKGLAHGLGVPLYGVGTLDSIAWCISDDYEGLVGVLGDAMRGEVYPALFDIAGEGGERTVRRRAADYVSDPEDAAEQWAALEAPMLLAGNGLAKYADLFSDALSERATLADPAYWAPTGAGLLRAFSASLAAGEMVGGDPGSVLPIYTRLSDAEEAEARRTGREHGPPPGSGVHGPAGDPPGEAHG